MACRVTPNEITGYSLFHLLLGREMTLPSNDDLKAKLSKDVKNSDHTRQIDNLKSILKLSVKKANKKSPLNNKMLCVRKAELRSSEIELVCLYNPTTKPSHRGQGAKCGP